jgi:glycosyltransferase involved in cell wall biosynthesis
MKILFFVPSFGKGGAATTQHWTELSEHLAKSHDVVVVVAYSAPFKLRSNGLTDSGVKLIKIGTRVLPRIANKHIREALMWFFMLLKSLFMSGKFDVVLCVDTPRFSSFIVLIRKIRDRCIAVVWVMDLTLEQVVKRSPKSSFLKITQFLNWIYYRSLSFCDKVVVLGTCMEDLMRSRGINVNRLKIIGPWIEECAGNLPLDSSSARESKVIPDLFTVTYRGYAGPWHEFDPLLEAIPDCLTKYPIQFLFAGNGPGIDRVAAAKLQYGWERVILQALVPKVELGELPYCGDVHMVSLKSNMLGTCVPSKAYSAMAYGRPVIFIGPAECQAARDIRDADAGIIVQTKEEFVTAIGKLYRDRKSLENFSRNARAAFLKKHCSTVLFRQWDEMLADIAGA